MFRSLFTPLSAVFTLPPTPKARSPQSPEEVQRDMRVQLMRGWVEDVKTAADVLSKVQILGEIQRMMVEDGFTKDVFRDADGFVVLVNLLSTLRPDAHDSAAVETSEGTRLAFAILAEAVRAHPVNKDWFEVTPRGYELLEQAILPLVCDQRTVDQTFGFLLALALQDFSHAGLFVSLRQGGGLAEAESLLTQSTTRLGHIQSPKAILVAVHLLEQVPKDLLLVYSLFKMIERLSMASHRNQAALNALGLVGILFARQYANNAADDEIPAQVQLVLSKLLRRMLDMGASMQESHAIFQHAVRRSPEGVDSLNMPVVDLLRTGMRAKWPEHFSMEGAAALVMKEPSPKGMPCPSGFSFVAWMSMEKFPVGADVTTVVFGVRVPGPGGRWLVRLALRPDGAFEFSTTASREPVVFKKPAAMLYRARWTHVVLTHHAHRRGASIPTVRLFVDGALVDAVNWAYPRIDAAGVEYVLGDEDGAGAARCCIASAYLLAMPLGDDMPRLFHHLGPRYTANFQAPSLIRFLTYEASASLNIHLASLRLEQNGSTPPSALTKAVANGVGFKEDMIVFAISPAGWRDTEGPNKTVENGVVKATYGVPRAEVRGDVVSAKPQCLDVSLWQVGGPAVTLRLVELAESPQDLCNTLSILCDGLRTSWQNSEDMERMSGYEILAAILRDKAQMINMSSYRVLMEFAGIDFGSPTHSTIVNAIVYEFVVLDMHIWSRTRKEVQTAHLDHFGVLLRDSDFARFNARQRMAKFNLVRKLLYVLQTDWYANDVVPHLIDAIRVVAEQNFSTDGAIKPMVSYLAANLSAEHAGHMTPSPRSIVSRIDRIHAHEKAEQVLEALVQIVHDPPRMKKFTTALPVTRIILLLLGEHPSSTAAAQILLLLALVVRSAPSFPRKFELVSGWNTLKTVLPPCWDPAVHVAAFDVLLGRTSGDAAAIMSPSSPGAPMPVVVCPQILPAILLSFGYGLEVVAGPYPNGIARDRRSTCAVVRLGHDVLVEEFIDLHASSESFRHLFQSQQTTALFVTAVNTFVDKIAAAPTLQDRTLRLTEKITHLILMLALDTNVDSAQKHELLEVLRKSEEAAVAASDGRREAADHAALVESVHEEEKSHRRRSSMMLNLRLVSDRVVQKSTSRLGQWRSTIMATEKKRLRKATQDVREYHRQAERLSDWRVPLFADRGLWAKVSAGPQLWRLDETEGPFRVRKKLEPEHDKAIVGTKILRDGVRDVSNNDAETASPVAIEVPPWAESYEFSSTDVEEDQQWGDDMTEDKLRRVRHQLEPGDVIQAVKTVTRIVGVDSSPGLLILGKTHVYMLDGLVENDEGEVIDACDAPKNVFTVPGTALELDGIQRAQRWSYDQVASVSKRSCLFRDVALEIYMRDSRTLLVVFSSSKERQEISTKLTMLHGGGHKTPEPVSAGGFRTPLIRSVGSKALTGFREEIWTAQRRWQAREISNFTYLSIINQTSGRTPADVTQYPVFPWVIADYESEELDLTSPATFRDLHSPMGALTEARRESAEQRYTNLDGIGETPFHYGTHFSSSMIVCHYLIRLSPFTHMFKTLQGGDWDLPDRLFSAVKRAYDSASQDSRGDVRELIPEFFTCPEFLENSARLDFGVQQNTGERIDDVKLPTWAKGDPLLFVTLNREALESDYVSEHLPAWIDLIWGCKQKDPESLNVFHPLSYEGAVDLDNISDELERAAAVGIIHNFGQTPRKIFTQAHPPRLMHGVTTLPLGTSHGIEEDHHLILQSPRPLKVIDAPVHSIGMDHFSEKPFPVKDNTLGVPGYINESVTWGHLDQSLRLVVDRKVVEVAEAAACSCAAFADSESLVTGSEDATVRIWRLSHRDNDRSRDKDKDIGSALRLLFILRGHRESIRCVAASRAWSIAVSGSDDGSLSIWDLNRGTYVRSISYGGNPRGPKDGIRLVAIQESTGHIASMSGERLALHTINGRPIAVLQLPRAASLGLGDDIKSLAFHEREWSKHGVLATGGSGGMTLRTWLFTGPPDGKDDRGDLGNEFNWTFKTLRSLKCRTEDDGQTPNITTIRFVGECIFTGDDKGRMYSWDLPE
ncbi:beach-domain-containing protein [Auriculariales sp. MPI-PUGE-AT-0066]|nr:beach-domain-containing protein [Auriculariales sp. MPI-PUGE-AT-0066]